MTGTVTSSTSSAKSKRTLVSTAMSTGRLWLASIVKPHRFVPELPTLSLGQFVAHACTSKAIPFQDWTRNAPGTNTSSAPVP